MGLWTHSREHRPVSSVLRGVRSIFCFIWLVISMVFLVSAHAQTVSIPDAGLDAAIRAALQKPVGPLTVPDMLSLTNLNATNRNIRSIEGLETARNLSVLELKNNALTNFALPNTLT